MLRKLAIYLLLLTTTFNVAGGYAVAASFNAASFFVCQINELPSSDSKTVVKKASSELVIVTTPLIKEGDEEKNQKFEFDFIYAVNEIPHFLPLLRAGPTGNFVNFSSVVKGKKAPLFLLNCNFRI